MRIPARSLTAGDVIQIHDWLLHVTAVDQDRGTAVLTAEFDFIFHFTRFDSVDVVREFHQPSPAA